MDILELAAVLGLGAILNTLVNAVISWLKGRQTEQRDAWTQRDKEAKARRQLEEMVHETRRVALEHGVKPEELPHWPESK